MDSVACLGDDGQLRVGHDGRHLLVDRSELQVELPG
jgi:hypothetical protein